MYKRSIPKHQTTYFAERHLDTIGDYAHVACSAHMVTVHGAVGLRAKLICNDSVSFHGPIGHHATIQCVGTATFHQDVGANASIKSASSLIAKGAIGAHSVIQCTDAVFHGPIGAHTHILCTGALTFHGPVGPHVVIQCPDTPTCTQGIPKTAVINGTKQASSPKLETQKPSSTASILEHLAEQPHVRTLMERIDDYFSAVFTSLDTLDHEALLSIKTTYTTQAATLEHVHNTRIFCADDLEQESVLAAIESTRKKLLSQIETYIATHVHAESEQETPTDNREPPPLPPYAP